MVREILEKSYVVAHIDVGSGNNRNTVLVDRYKAPVFKDRIPAPVITMVSGELLAALGGSRI